MIKTLSIYNAIVVLIAICLTSCIDEPLYDYAPIGDGISDLNATVSFLEPEPALESRAPGDAVGRVNILWLVMYKVNEDASVTYFNKYLASQLDDYSIDQDGNKNEPADTEKGDNLGATGETTPHASFSLKHIPYGRYRIYAVANVASLPDKPSEEELKAISFDWKTNVSENNAMFGYFTAADKQTSQGFQAPDIIINKKNINLHSWIKRLVSKVTVAFDPSELKEAVTVYIKDVTIHDIPNSCCLGIKNEPDDDKKLIHDGEVIKYYTSETANDFEKWGIKLQKGVGIKGSNHSNEAEALYFFENMQGNFPDQKQYLKEQIPDETGTSIDAPDPEKKNDFKDRRPYGTYIEVTGYYLSQNKEKMSSGIIKYRFMLGKNITYNYNAERNFHYKLTLKLRGFANEADWHISYNEPTPSLYTPAKYYISYLYGHSLNFPVRIITGDDNVKKYKVKATIIENNWAPYEEQVNGAQVPETPIGAYNDINGFAWNKYAYENAGYYKGANYAGFLSLKRPQSGNILPDINYGEAANEELKTYYYDNKIGESTYNLSVAGDNYVDGNSSKGTYNVKYEDDKSVTLTVPMFTREAKMVPASDFSGNNPFPYYMRAAAVKFELLDENGNTVAFKDDEDPDKDVLFKTVPIYQVRRIENPKAIYRAHNRKDPFTVKLMRLESAEATKFKTFTSDGPWRASILVDPDGFVKLTGLDKTVVTKKGEYINGESGTEIIFTYEPSSTIKKNETRCAIILVEYHDYTCSHLIYVRQGYNKGVRLGNADWSCYQVYATGAKPSSNQPQQLNNVKVVVTKSPLSVGSFYKRMQYNYGIREENNKKYGWLKPVGSNDLSTTYIANDKATTGTGKWDNIWGYAWANGSGTQNRYNYEWADTWTTVEYQAGQKLTVPTAEQYLSLVNNCDFGYGIAYADGATTTAELRTDAYGFTDYSNTGSDNTNGVRVCVVYDKSNGNNILFPMGSIGQSRRARAFSNGSQQNQTNPGAGSLSYSGMLGLIGKDGSNNNNNRPLTFNIYRHTGAIYWIKKPVTKLEDGKTVPDYASWDIGYFNLVFNHYDYGSLGGWWNKQITSTSASNGSDALPIKLIYK